MRLAHAASMVCEGRFGRDTSRSSMWITIPVQPGRKAEAMGTRSEDRLPAQVEVPGRAQADHRRRRSLHGVLPSQMLRGFRRRTAPPDWLSARVFRGSSTSQISYFYLRASGPLQKFSRFAIVKRTNNRRQLATQVASRIIHEEWSFPDFCGIAHLIRSTKSTILLHKNLLTCQT
jgi:hypothetical protein